MIRTGRLEIVLFTIGNRPVKAAAWRKLCFRRDRRSAAAAAATLAVISHELYCQIQLYYKGAVALQFAQYWPAPIAGEVTTSEIFGF
jgi:hypothetical protein